MKCPKCESEVSGKFCGICGGALEARRCHECASEVPAGHSFCSACGANQGGSRAPVAETPTKFWWLGGAGIAALLLLSLPYILPDRGEEGGDGSRTLVTGNLGGAGNIDLASMTPREAADRLFNRVMTAFSAGDDPEVTTFLPMAIDAYNLVEDLDADGWFHLSLLHQAGGNPQAAMLAAQEVLAIRPTHLLGLYSAGEASRELNDEPAARGYFTALVNSYDAELAVGLAEYQEHASFLPTIREVAEGFLAAFLTRGDG